MDETYWRGLGLRWAALGLPWMPGMLDWWLGRVNKATPAGWDRMIEAYEAPWTGEGHEWREPDVPDFRDPATLGCLLAQVRERWNCRWAYLSPSGDGWMVNLADMQRDRWFDGATEAEALIVALERRATAAGPRPSGPLGT